MLNFNSVVAVLSLLVMIWTLWVTIENGKR
jgi:hypothetical protein